MAKHKEKKLPKTPGYFKLAFEKGRRTAEESLENESNFISLLISLASFCPSISILEGSKRLCKDDLVDELLIIDAIEDHPRRKALKTYFKTVFTAIHKNAVNYFNPLFSQNNKRTTR